MQPLEKNLRNQLERNVKEARDIAETAARAALGQLGVETATPFEYLNEHERRLRCRLRAHARQLGDRRHAKSQTQNTERLIEEVAYEHWHRMLFARFLAENDLLMYPDPDSPVPVTLKECEELAVDEGASNGWELAARFASRMLPQIFRLDSPIFELKLPPEHQHKLERLLAALPVEIFHASDSLGWVYQYWQSRRKEEVNKAEIKIGARELPAVTQLFTEPYMVSFLLDNALGAWWASRQLSPSDFQNAKSEEELRRKAAIPGVPLEFLRFVRQLSGSWAPAAGTFPSWPEHLEDLKTLDPCCGSGHFLVAAFLMLVPMRMAREGLTAKDAVDAVLRENLHGLEIDLRCVSLAAFALALTAWKYPDAGGYRVLPELNLACSGLSVSLAKEEWKALGLGKDQLTMALDLMHENFQSAPLLGSLLHPARSLAAKVVEWNELAPSLEQALKEEPREEVQEAGIVAHGLARAAVLLAGRYSWVITNVPYLARGKQNECLKEFCETHYPSAKNDLATVFLDRCLEFCVEGGTTSFVLPQNWLFLTTYRKFRERLLRYETWHLIARLGEGGFDSTAAAGAFVSMFCLSRGHVAAGAAHLYRDASNWIHGLDVSDFRSAAEKAKGLLTQEISAVDQDKQLANPDSRVAFTEIRGELLETFATSYEGLTTGDLERFVLKFWETSGLEGWQPYIQNSTKPQHFAGRADVIQWGNKGEHLSTFPGAYIKGLKAWGKLGIRVTQMRELAPTLYRGEIFGKNAATIVSKKQEHLPAIWCFCSSPDYNEAVRRIDQKLNVTIATLVKVPFDLDYWTTVAKEKYPHGLPEPYSNDPTQWIFHGHPCGSVIWHEEKKSTAQGPLRTDETVLQVAVARLLGYRWPAEFDPAMALAQEQREWVNRSTALTAYADEDGIVCIPPVRGEAPAAERLLNLLAAAYGSAWSNEVLATLLKNAEHTGKTLETWLREKFFSQHCKLFQHRPFVWQIWDGLRDGFSALVNYHLFDAKLLESLIYTYLGDWIGRQKQEIAQGVDGSQERLAAAQALQKKLELILQGEAPYDIFVRWKPLEKQPIGWNPDLNDGVRLNIRPFLRVPDVGKRGAGVLRDKPNIHWNKDRGKDVASAPWYELFQGERINDHHLNLSEKREARADRGPLS